MPTPTVDRSIRVAPPLDGFAITCGTYRLSFEKAKDLITHHPIRAASNRSQAISTTDKTSK